MKINKKHIFALLVFIIIEVVITYPLILKINNCIPGFYSTDEPYAVLWGAWFNKFALSHNISIKETDFLAYPFGIDFYTNKPTGYLWFSINYILAIVINPILTYNLQVILNFLLVALFTYLLVYKISGNQFSAIFSGIILGFCPYMFARAWQHLGETYLWPMPLFLWSLFRLREEDTLRIKLLFMVSLLFVTINFDVTYYTLVIFGTFIIYMLFNLKGNYAYIRKIILLGNIAFIILIPQFFIIFKNLILGTKVAASAHNPYYRPFEDLFAQSARPLSYFLPTTNHPLFGKFTQIFIGSMLYGKSITEHSLYLGLIPLVLAFTAFRKLRPQIKAKVSIAAVSEPEKFYIRYFIILSIIAWLFSQPPWWKFGPIKLYMPSFFMYKILPMFRAYCRFGSVLMLAIAVLAGFGLKFILERFESQRIRIAIFFLLCSFVLFEFWNYPPFKVINVSKVPEVYYWLKKQPADIVIAEYYLDFTSPNEMYKFYQTTHEKRMINATIPGTAAYEITQMIKKLSDPRTAGILKWLGANYAIVHRQAYLATGQTEWIDEPDKIKNNPGLKFVQSFPAQSCPEPGFLCVLENSPIDVYQIVARPIKPEINK